MNSSSQMGRTEVLRVELEIKRSEHRDLDAAIAALHEKSHADMLTLQRLKRKKLALKDQISRLEDAIIPDIIA
jgi:hypothetical protein